MSDTVIKVDNLSKMYRIGETLRHDTLRDAISHFGSRFIKQFSHRPNPAPSTLHPAPKIPLTANRQPLTETIWALKDVSFEVKRGEIIGIIGRNGAGKSTLLKILSRITEPTEGRAEIRGRVGSLLEVGTGFHSELTGRENIFLNGAILGMTKREIKQKFNEIVAFAEIEKFIDTPVKRYSSGMYVRLAFAVAAHLQPEILLIDEVLAVGDIEFQKKCIGKMEKVAEEGKTVMVVSHSMNTVKALCSKAILLDSGAIRSIGQVDAVVAEYLSGHQVDIAEKIISDNDHITGVSKIRVLRIKLLNGVGNSFSVYWQQPISVAIEIKVYEWLDDVSFGIGIKTVDGTWILSVHHDDCGLERWTLDSGNYRIKFVIQNNLGPGLYKLVIGAHRCHWYNNLFHTEAVNLEVLNYSQNGDIAQKYNPGLINGDVIFQMPECLI
jgi:lipopolysaccharide transport system ATP-binding protein